MKRKAYKLTGVFVALIMLTVTLSPLHVAYAENGITVNVAYDPSTCTADVSWNAVPGAASYKVWLLNDDESGTAWAQANRTMVIEIATNSCTLSKDKYFMVYGNGGDNYKVDVYAYNASGSRISEGASAAFQTGLSPLKAPTITLDSNGVATWTAVSGADRYYCKCYQDHSYPVESGFEYGLTCDYSSVFVPESDYYVQINAVGNGRTTRNSKEVESNTITVEGSKEDISGFMWSGTTLFWDAFPRATTYDFWILKKAGVDYIQQGATHYAVDNHYDFAEFLSQYGEGNYVIEITAVSGFLKLSNRTQSPVCEYTESGSILSGTVRIAGGVKHYGDLLRLEYTGDIASIPSSKLSFEWQESDNKATWTNIIGETGPTYQTPSSGDSTNYVRVRVTAEGYEGAVYSDIRAIIPKPVTAPFEGTVSIVQDHASEAYFVIGEPITATARNTAGNVMTMDGMTYRWQRRYEGNSSWVYIPFATGRTYTPGIEDENCFLRVEVSYRQAVGELYSTSKWVDWMDESYTVSFDLQGHGSGIPSQTIRRGAHATVPAAPIASGFTFVGWYRDPECEGLFNFDERILDDITLYADWTEDGLFVMSGAEISAVVERNAGDYIIDDESAEIVWKGGAAPSDPSMVEARASSHLFNDAALTDKLHDEPVPGVAYYAEFTFENSVRYDRSVDFSKLMASSFSFDFPGYTVSCRSVDVGIDSMGYSRAVLRMKLVKNPPIEMVYINGITPPKAGAYPDYEASFPGGAKYYSDPYTSTIFRNDIAWKDLTDDYNLVPDKSVFKAGHQYIVYVYLTARSGYVFSEEAEAMLNGSPAEAEMTGDQLGVTYVFTASGGGTSGDVNLDGSVDAADLTALARHVSNIDRLTDPEAIANADVTGEGDISAADLTRLARYVAKIINEL